MGRKLLIITTSITILSLVGWRNDKMYTVDVYSDDKTSKQKKNSYIVFIRLVCTSRMG